MFFDEKKAGKDPHFRQKWAGILQNVCVDTMYQTVKKRIKHKVQALEL